MNPPLLRRPLGFSWLLRLRWLAVAGQLLACWVSIYGLGARLPLGILGGCMGVTVLTNLAAWWWVRRTGRTGGGVSAALVVLDLVTLTVMLYWTGGAQNPFTAFYLLHVTIAAILLPPWGAWLGVGVAVAGYGVLFLSPHELESASGGTCCETHSAHLQGMLVALALTGGAIAFFVGKLSAELRRREGELLEARMQTVRDERFASLATLAAGVAHELATPLGTIAVVARELERVRREGVEEFPEMKVIRAEVERCRTVLEGLGDQAERGRDAAREVALAEVAAGLGAFVSPEVWGRVDVAVPAPEARLRVPVEALWQSLAVLVKNAVEASPGEGRVGLSMRWEGGEAVFEVEDAGEGMSPEVRARAGEPFFTTKEPGRGIGLGLFLVRMFVERVRGRLRVESAPGRGSRVRLVVPAMGEEDAV